MKRQGTSGVSQLELMISLIIMGMITVLLANALNFNRQSLDRSRVLSDETEMLLGQHSLRQWLEDIPLNYTGKNARSFFEGDGHSLRFKTLVSDGSFLEGEPAEFTLGVTSTEEGVLFIVRGEGRHPTKEASHFVQRILAQDVSAFKMSYFGRIASEPEKHWHKLWSDNTYLPDLVKIEWVADGLPAPPLTLQPGKVEHQRYMSLSSLVPPG